MASFASEVSVTQSDEFFSRFGRYGGNMELLKQLLANDERMRSWVQSVSTPVAISGYTVSVNRSLTLVQMIEAGKYSNHKDAIASITEERFPVDRSGELTYDKELFLVAPSREGITTKQWKAELEANGWELEQTPELLAFGEKYPDLQREHYIVAFGSSWRDSDGDVSSPALWGVDGERGADTNWYYSDDQWYLHDRALVSRKRR